RRPISGIPTSSRSIRRSIISPNATRRSSASTPACCGPKARHGARKGAIWCGATFPTTGRCDGRRTMVTSASFDRRPITGFDFQGRQLSCEHLTRRVVRYEHDGTATVLADSYSGKRLNSPNDIVAHPDGSYWFTDPPYGGQLYEGEPDAAGGPSN